MLRVSSHRPGMERGLARSWTGGQGWGGKEKKTTFSWGSAWVDREVWNEWQFLAECYPNLSQAGRLGAVSQCGSYGSSHPHSILSGGLQVLWQFWGINQWSHFLHTHFTYEKLYFHRNPVLNNLYPLKDSVWARKLVSHFVLDNTWSAEWSSSELTCFYIICHYCSHEFSCIITIFQFEKRLNGKGKKQNAMRQVDISTQSNVRTINHEQDTSGNIDYVSVANGIGDSLSRMI